MTHSPAPATAHGPDTPASAEEAVMVTLARLGRRMRQRHPDEDLDFGAILLMKTLAHEPLRLSSLAAALDLDASTVSRHVRHLEERGLLDRSDDPDDRRASRVDLSPLGRQRLEAGARRRRDFVGALLADWPPEDREHLRILLTRLLDELDHHQETP